MNINTLNQSDISPPPSTTMSPSQGASAPNINTVPPPISTKQAGIDNKPKSEEQIRQAVEKIQDAVDNVAHDLHFSIDKDTGKTIIKVMDTHTKEVIRQMPTDEAINIARTLDKVQGLLFNDKA